MGGAVDKPAAEVEVTPALVRALLAEQHPDLADRPLTPLSSGWDNTLIRVGDDLVARLPRREVAVPLVANELRWLPELAEGLPLPTSAPVRVGRPGAGYPWPWTLVAYLPGRSALHAPLADPQGAARTLGRFVRALHRPAPPEAPENPYRGVALADRDERTLGWVEQLAPMLEVVRVRDAWAAAVAAPRWPGPPLWLHGDLHPNNIIVDRGHIGGIVDFGDLTSGDPATDLIAGWMLFEPPARSVLRAEVGADEATWARARGWALTLGLAYLAHSADDPAFERVGLRTIRAVVDDPEA